MISRIWSAVRNNSALILLTFELFWIAVFVLDKLGSGGGGGVPRFVYVDF